MHRQRLNGKASVNQPIAALRPEPPSPPSLPSAAGPVFTCSLDDGHPSDMRAAELLVRHRLNGTFYVPITNSEGDAVLTASAIRALAQQFEVGSHTLDHCYLKRLPLAEARRQICEGKARLEDIVGHGVDGFCYPGGKYRQEHVGLVAAAGFRYARTVMNLHYDSGGLPFEMPTTLQFFPHHRNLYLRNFIRGGNWSRRQDALKVALRHEHWLDRLYALFDHAVEHGAVFHLWGHSLDIDRFGIWTEFDRFLAHVASCVPQRNRLDNGQLAARGVAAVHQV
jgi:peptidoglycan/xylan/chitin deacetylase (PgdA/CDA1 family)